MNRRLLKLILPVPRARENFEAFTREPTTAAGFIAGCLVGGLAAMVLALVADISGNVFGEPGILRAVGVTGVIAFVGLPLVFLGVNGLLAILSFDAAVGETRAMREAREEHAADETGL